MYDHMCMSAAHNALPFRFTQTIIRVGYFSIKSTDWVCLDMLLIVGWAASAVRITFGVELSHCCAGTDAEQRTEMTWVRRPYVPQRWVLSTWCGPSRACKTTAWMDHHTAVLKRRVTSCQPELQCYPSMKPNSMGQLTSMSSKGQARLAGEMLVIGHDSWGRRRSMDHPVRSLSVYLNTA